VNAVHSPDLPPGRTGTPVSTPTPASFSAGHWAWLLTSFAAVAFVAVGWPILAAVHGIPVVVAMVLSIAQAATLPVAVRWPRIGILLGAAAALGTMLSSGIGGVWPWPVTTLLAYLCLILLIALRHPWRLGAAAWLAGMAVSVVAVSMASGMAGVPPEDVASGWGNTAVYAGVGSGVLAMGTAVQVLWQSRSQLRSERRISAEQQAQRQELQQRNRIAQELHDVVAHSMSVISVQATTAPYRLPGLDETVKHEFESIAGSSRRALNEMRGLLAVLRGDDDAATAPQPGLTDIAELVATSRASGATVDLQMSPALGDERLDGVPPATGLTGYRIVQEALSNALRHSPGAPVSVWIELDEREVTVSVVNGTAQDPGRVSPAGSGLGLPGMRDRAQALGGTVRAAPTADGGFSVQARLPLG
jgi:signal transduction histidine kinase